MVPPQNPQFIYARNCASVQELFGAISTDSVLSTIFELETVYVQGAFVPLQPDVVRVISDILLFISAHRVLGLSLWGLGPTLIQNSKLIDVTLDSGSWGGSEPPYTYTINNSSITDTNEAVEIAPNNSATDEQLIAYMACGLCGGTISSGKIVLKAFGSKPEINIPIVMIIRGEI